MRRALIRAPSLALTCSAANCGQQPTSALAHLLRNNLTTAARSQSCFRVSSSCWQHAPAVKQSLVWPRWFSTGPESSDSEINTVEEGSAKQSVQISQDALNPFQKRTKFHPDQGSKRDQEVFVHNMRGEPVGTMVLSGAVFDVPIRQDIVHDIVKWQRACARAGLAHTKTRGEVRGSSRKPHPQKGTGRARRGDNKAPHHKGGGVAHGPRRRDWSYKMNLKVQILALKIALSARLAEGRLMIVDQVQVDPEKPLKTKEINKCLKNLIGGKPVLIMDLTDTDKRAKEFRQVTNNLPDVDVMTIPKVNVYDILKKPVLCLSKDSVEWVTSWLERPIRPPPGLKLRMAELRARFLEENSGEPLTVEQYREINSIGHERITSGRFKASKRITA